MKYFAEYGLFFAETLTLALAIVFTVIAIIAFSRKRHHDGQLTIKCINKDYDQTAQALQEAILPKDEWKKLKKTHKKQMKAHEKGEDKNKKRIYVLNFVGDMQAHAVNQLREEVTALLLIATPQDEVLIKIESPGGVVNGYGLAASQLARIRERNIPLIASIDKVAASGGYLMACVAPQILAAPFAAVGSIGVVAQLPNFHRLLKKHEIDFEQITAGEYKRTLSLFGENTEKAREKVKDDVEETHTLFKNFVKEHRPQVDIGQVATGEYWLATKALELKLVDVLMTSDDYLLKHYPEKEIYSITYSRKRSLIEKIQGGVESSLAKLRGDAWG